MDNKKAVKEDTLHIFQADDYNEGVLLRTNLLRQFPVDIDKLLLGANDDTPTGNIVTMEKAREFVSNEENGAAGLAAPQVGAWGAWFVMKMGRPSRTVIIINPEIIARDGNKQMEEGCFSESSRAIVKRSREITANYHTVECDEDGAYTVVYHPLARLEGWEARVFQHEYQHLQGRLISDVGKVIELESNNGNQ